MSICKAYKKDGSRCTSPAKESGYCGRHKHLAAAQRDESPSPPPRETAPSYTYTEPVTPAKAPDSKQLCEAYKKDGSRCTSPAKENGYCGRHKHLAAASKATVELALSTPSPGARSDTDTAGKGFGFLSPFSKGKKAENIPKTTGRRGAMAEVLKLCRTEKTEDPYR